MDKESNLDYFTTTNDQFEIIVDKIYLSSRSACIESRDLAYGLLEQIANHFKIDYKRIYFTGSVHIGFSLKSKQFFTPNSSDLDIAIVDKNLYSEITYAVQSETNFLEKTSFRNDATYYSYVNNLAKGRIHPLYFPATKTKRDWDYFFRKLTQKYNNNFSKITACVYLSEKHFRFFQIDSLKLFKLEQEIHE